MNKYIQSIDKFFKKAPALHVDEVFDGGSRYLFKIKNDRYKNEKDLIDPWYTIDKKTTKVEGFLPYKETQWFNETLKHPVKSFI